MAKRNRQRFSEFRRSGTGVRLTTLLLVGIAIAAVLLSPQLRDLEKSGLILLSGTGAFAPAILAGGYVVVALLLLPAFPLDFAAGAHFGFWWGTLWVQLAAGIASMAGYGLGRIVLRRWLEKVLRWKPELRDVQRAVTQDGARIVFLSRLSPIFSFSLLNGFYGAVGVPFGKYVLATLAGMVPGTAIYVYAGMMAGDLSGAPGRSARTPMQWSFEILGFVATIVIVVIATRKAQRILGDKLKQEES